MHQTLYRKYRPRTFDGEGGVVGQEQVASGLQYEAAPDRPFPAYPVCGPRGTGKDLLRQDPRQGHQLRASRERQSVRDLLRLPVHRRGHSS